MSDRQFPILNGYSVEILPREADPQALARFGLPAGSEVFLAHLPGHKFADVVQAAEKLAKAGYVPVPHFCVRRWTDRAMVGQVMQAMRRAGVDRLLVIAGEAPSDDRLWDSALEFLRDGMWRELHPAKFFVAGHPEGQPHEEDGGMQVLLAKQAFSRAHDVDMGIVSQFVLDAALFAQWDADLRRIGINLPVRAGLPGRVTPTTLAKYALRCGVGVALQASGRQKERMLKLAKAGGMEGQVADLQACRHTDPGSLIQKVHFFPFGSLQNTLEWVAHRQA